MAIENLTATTLRNIIGDLELDQTLNHLAKDVINPFKNNGRIWALHEDTNILYLVQNVDNKQFTISFSPIANAWIS